MFSEEEDNKKVHCLTIYRFAEDHLGLLPLGV